jgi:hypothetical protein
MSSGTLKQITILKQVLTPGLGPSTLELRRQDTTLTDLPKV